jgi:hypothetical protein
MNQTNSLLVVGFDIGLKFNNNNNGRRRLVLMKVDTQSEALKNF